jgi:diacylglycerol kinase
MALVIHSLQMAMRGVARAYTSDFAYHGGLLLMLAVLALTLTLSVVEHIPQAAAIEPVKLCWAIDPACP